MNLPPSSHSARSLLIQEKVKLDIGAVRPSDFVVRDGGSVEPELVLRNPNVSLYCLDFENRRAIFVETPPDRDLLKEPFLYMAQYDAATRLIQVPFETMRRLANEVSIDGSQLILIYSVGRCGSTLVSRVFHEMEGVESLSEPDVFTQMLAEWGTKDLRGSEKSNLLMACTLLQCSSGQSRQATAWVLKFRSMVTALGPMFYSCFPAAKNIFLYRNAAPWMASMQRTVRVADPTTPIPVSEIRSMFGRAFPILDSEGAPSFLEFSASLWASCMANCDEMQRSGVPMFLARYEELKRSPERVLQAMFSFCNLSTRSVANMHQVLAEDSQAGSTLSRENTAESHVQLTTAHKDELDQLIRMNAPGLTSDFIHAYTHFP